MPNSIKSRNARSRRYTYYLADPIYEALPAAGSADELDSSVETSCRKIDKLLKLLELYKIDSLAKHRWLRLALALAEQHVPGFRVIHEPPHKRGRPRSWKAGQADSLLHDVEELRRANKKLTIKSAIDQLRADPSKNWRTCSKENLVTRHREARREREKHFRLATEAGLVAGLGSMQVKRLESGLFAGLGPIPTEDSG